MLAGGRVPNGRGWTDPGGRSQCHVCERQKLGAGRELSCNRGHGGNTANAGRSTGPVLPFVQ